MKKTLFLLAVLILATTSCSKTARNESQLVKAMLSDDYDEAKQGLADCYEWLRTDKETMTYDFPLMKEKLGMKVNTSADGMVRLYSWLSNIENSAASYANAVQWKVDDKMVAFTGPLNMLFKQRKVDISNRSTQAHSIDTIFDIDKTTPHVYMVVQSYVDEEGMTLVYVSAFTRQGLKLAILPFYFDGMESAGNRVFIDDGDVKKSELIKWDPKEMRLYSYLTDDNNHVIPGKYEIYVLGRNQFTRTGPDQEQ